MEKNGASTSTNSVDRPAAAGSGAVVRTFLIADVRGYTSFTHAHGDEEAGKLAERFARLAREAVAATGGEVIELRGDEALCVFSSARQALRAAAELQIRFRERISGEAVFPLGIGIGLASGEAVAVEGGYRGGALNLAARLCSLAAGGQIFASETVTSLAGRLEGVRFRERRAVRVKGLEKPVRAMEVIPEIELPPVPEVPRARARGRGVLVLAVGAVVLASGLAAALVTVTRDSKQTVEGIATSAPNAVAVIDPAKTEVVDAIPVGESPGPIVAGRDSLWVVNLNDRTLMKIDSAARSVVASLGLPAAPGRLSPELRLAVTSDDVWVYACHLQLLRVDPRNTQIVEELDVYPDTGAFSEYSCAVAAEAGSVWVPIDYPRRRLFRIAASKDEPALIAERIPLPAGFRSAIALGAGSIWMADSLNGAVRRIDPATTTVTRTIPVSDGANAMAFGHGAVWIANDREDSVLRIRPRTNSIVRAISVGRDPVALAVGADAIWVANSGDGTVSRIDPATSTVIDTIRVGHRPLGVAVAGGLVWVTVRT
jgi:YVTN family beta-propeller protein